MLVYKIWNSYAKFRLREERNIFDTGTLHYNYMQKWNNSVCNAVKKGVGVLRFVERKPYTKVNLWPPIQEFYFCYNPYFHKKNLTPAFSWPSLFRKMIAPLSLQSTQKRDDFYGQVQHIWNCKRNSIQQAHLFKFIFIFNILIINFSAMVKNIEVDRIIQQLKKWILKILIEITNPGPGSNNYVNRI